MSNTTLLDEASETKQQAAGGGGGQKQFKYNVDYFPFISGFCCSVVAQLQYRFYIASVCSCLLPHFLQLQRFAFLLLNFLLFLFTELWILPTISLTHRDICWPRKAKNVLTVPCSHVICLSKLWRGLQQLVLWLECCFVFFFLANGKAQTVRFVCLSPLPQLSLETLHSKGMDWSFLKQRKLTYSGFQQNNTLRYDSWENLVLGHALYLIECVGWKVLRYQLGQNDTPALF